MTLLLAIIILAMLAWIVERLDRLHEDAADIIWLLEQHAPPPRGGERTASRAHRRG